MAFVSVRELHNRTSDVLRQVREGRVVFITHRGRPIGVVRGLTEEELEEFALLHHPSFRRALKEAISDARAGRTVPLDEALHKLERPGN